MSLPAYLEASARRTPDRVAVEDSEGRTMTYGDLDRLATRLAAHLLERGVIPGDRVGVCVPKSIDTVAVLFGIMKAGAAYVPVDPNAPPRRNASILQDCGVKVVVVSGGLADGLARELGSSGPEPDRLVIAEPAGGSSLSEALDKAGVPPQARVTPGGGSGENDLAYILYTSGSTGKPKGVMLSHGAASSFVDWCSEVFAPTEDDRFSSHAPFHFDLSILDLYVPLKHGGTLVLVSDDLGKDPRRLAPFIAERRLTAWYSTPSILSLLAQSGRLELVDLSHLRFVFFAGEVFPVSRLRELKSRLPHPRYFNLYGPTETNVCTFYEIPREIPEDRFEPFPIGRACSHCRTTVLDGAGASVAPGEEGELWVRGPSVMLGYWGRPQQTAEVFRTGPDGGRWYRTGDVVIEQPDGDYRFVGRRDRMVKRRGYRVELGEIEACLHAHAAVREAAVVAEPDPEVGLRIRAFLGIRGAERPSIIDLKRFCSERLPGYMIPDVFHVEPSLPRTSTDKIDYQALRERS